MHVQGQLDALAVLLPNLAHLGLSDNLLGRWQDVHSISHHLQSLTALNLSFNRLEDAASLQQLSACTNIQTLVLNGCNVEWPDVLAVGHAMPELRELYLSENGISSLAGIGTAESGAGAPMAKALPQLQVLDLMQNRLSRWQDVQPLSQLTTLSELKLSDNPLKAVEVRGASCTTELQARGVTCFLHVCNDALCESHDVLRIAQHASACSFDLTCHCMQRVTLSSWQCCCSHRATSQAGRPSTHSAPCRLCATCASPATPSCTSRASAAAWNASAASRA